MINMAIVDDDSDFLEELKEISEKYFISHFVEHKLSTFSKGCNLIYELQEGKKFHIYLLDIELSDGEINGLKLAEFIQAQKNANSYVIFITNHLEFALNGYELDIFRYYPERTSRGKTSSGSGRNRKTDEYSKRRILYHR